MLLLPLNVKVVRRSDLFKKMFPGGFILLLGEIIIVTFPSLSPPSPPYLLDFLVHIFLLFLIQEGEPASWWTFSSLFIRYILFDLLCFQCVSEFMAVEGSKVFNSFRNGSLRYVRYVLMKPEVPADHPSVSSSSSAEKCPFHKSD